MSRPSTANAPTAALKASNDGDKMQQDIPDKSSSSKEDSNTKSLQDRVFNAILKQVLPQEEGVVIAPIKGDNPSKKSQERPNFSLPIMSNNFRRFNSRIGVVFVFQDKASWVLSWKQPSQTLSLLAVYAFCCLNPAIVTILPLLGGLFFIMVPAFYARHPPPPTTQLVDTYAGQGPAIAPPANIKPVPDMSKAFFANMRALQNSMEDFTVIYDQLVNAVQPLTNFADERLSSTVFIATFFGSALLFIASFVVPWRFLFLLLGWAAVGSLHPGVAAFIRSIDKSSLRKAIKAVQAKLYQWMSEDIVLDEAPEMREVEIFELQRQTREDNWEPWIYGTSVYDPQSTLRICGDRPRGVRFFEDVQPPKGWEWSDKKWSLDLLSQEWVEERMITAVEVETEGERWVYDMGDADLREGEGRKDVSVAKTPLQTPGFEAVPVREKGEWRRRRWVRVVKRKRQKEQNIIIS